MHIRAVDIEFDPAKAAANLKKHGVSFAHAEQALRDPAGLTIRDWTLAARSAMRPWGRTPWDVCWS